MEGGKPENTEKNSRCKARANNKLNPPTALGQNRAQATLMGGRALAIAPSLLLMG